MQEKAENKRIAKKMKNRRNGFIFVFLLGLLNTFCSVFYGGCLVTGEMTGYYFVLKPLINQISFRGFNTRSLERGNNEANCDDSHASGQ